ncbi:MAG: precorrin-3B C(17)-methyltransferase [Candidatus Scalindua rubra]|uniref:Methyltransferase n=1 Tax=Candidatus Scalindua brodae TaxID=237368 RepID=A0A0B0EN50_9BACT|nr:MAG: methyltransferase [Candidatus Scalindua brodae]MBZ0108115.1 precorrin-3B C(17)-methyltransferase [Candidatus Scalindua rubra]TWU31266.1 Cobalt-precorrin-3B C(17)-methyltransferase [Candidatus Brocadiaceae bacterium S225]
MVGIGPGNMENMSIRAVEVIKNSDCVIGYKTYINLIKELVEGKEVITSGMRSEIERASLAIEKAEAGKVVSVISSGDPGVFGMAGLVLEVANNCKLKIPVEVVPGIPSENAAAALLGAPLMHDHVTISLSDLLTPWDVIEKRVGLAAEGDFVVVLYNPKSSERKWQIEKTIEILLSRKSSDTPVGIVKSAMRKKQNVIITNLGDVLEHPIDMTTILIVGNSTTFVFDNYMVTKRGYNV